MTHKERFLAGEIFTISYSVTKYKFDGDQESPGIDISIKPGDFWHFALVEIGNTQVKWKKLLLGKWIEGKFKFSELKFVDAKGGAIK